MSSAPLRPFVHVLLPLLLVVGCGTSETLPPDAEESLGTQEAAVCSGLTVTTLTLSGASTYLGEMAASGSWAVSAGANAVRLEYYIDNVLYSVEERTGTSGTWYFSNTGVACGARTLLVKAWPMVIDSGGNRTTCYGALKTLSQTVTEACPTTWKFMYTEYCYDRWTVSCYQVNPQPACPTDPEGKSCSTSGAMCWRILDHSEAERYRCL
ncbi:MAG TPA: hypothetical protein VFZ09_22930 [Archangium sp.]|uniref:hypothetical protein n=1 Tax=Archangium sp. TaxID=1872627 RepID=UPI002E338CCB|nr:hypothetical protein [Archangium sp.]HEX5749115.1 hypothetical protein [Archangium sp.]